MGINQLFIQIQNLFYRHTIIFIVVIVVIAGFIFFKPKETIKVVCVLLALAFGFYMLSYMGEAAKTGKSNTDQYTTSPDKKKGGEVLNIE